MTVYADVRDGGYSVRSTPHICSLTLYLSIHSVAIGTGAYRTPSVNLLTTIIVENRKLWSRLRFFAIFFRKRGIKTQFLKSPRVSQLNGLAL